MEVVLLSQYPELLKQCVDLLNKQWKRSFSARLQSLEKSCTCLPDSLLLIEAFEGEKIVIGHSRLKRVLEDPYGCWIESVVISEEKRKNGYGKYLMQKTEEYAKILQFTTAYLNTHDQQGFYEHLGYTYCSPVSSISFTWNGFILQNTSCNSNDYQNENSLELNKTEKNFTNIDKDMCTETAFPPPPPPPPSKTLNMQNKLKSNLGQYWMKKRL